MTTANDFFQDKQKSSSLFCGNFGEGKTSFLITYPKFFYIGFRPGGLSVIKQEKNKKYQGNLVRYEELIAKDDAELKTMFEPMRGKFSLLLKEAIDMAQKGEIESLILDDTTDAVNAEQKYVWTHQKATTSTGAPDTQSMYGQLGRNLSDRFEREILPFMKHGNLAVAVHLMRESEQQIQGGAVDKSTGLKTRAGAVDKQSDMYPDIIGGYRREIQRKFENVFYLETKLDAQGGRKYKAYTCKQQAMGTVILAKNVLGLDPVIENATFETIFKPKQTTK